MIKYIPTEYRKATPSTLGLWAQNMQPLLQMYVQHEMQKDLLEKQIDVDKTRVRAVNKEWDRRFEKQQGVKGKSLDKTLYDEYGLIRVGKGFAKIAKGKISMISPPEADNLKNEQISKWIADKTLIPVDANYPAGDPSFKFQDRNYYFNPTEDIKEPYKIGHIKDFKVGDKYISKKYLGKGEWGKVGEAPRYKPTTTIINVRAEELHKLKKGISAGENRTALIAEETNKSVYEAKGLTFNDTNPKNEVAYWDTKEGWLKKGQTKIIKLSAAAIKAGYTPKKIQAKANAEGRSVESILKEGGIIK